MKTIQEHLEKANERNKKVMEKQKQYHWKNMSEEKKKQTLKINLTTNFILLLLCIFGLAIFKDFWLISLLILSIISLGVNVTMVYRYKKGL